MERSMQGIRLYAKVPNERIGNKTKVTDSAVHIANLKYVWASHVLRREDGAETPQSGL